MSASNIVRGKERLSKPEPLATEVNELRGKQRALFLPRAVAKTRVRL